MRNKFARVSDPNEFVTCPGDPIEIIYGETVEKDGEVVIAPIGKKNIQDEINSFAGTTDIDYMMQRISVGDISVLSQKEPFFGDFTRYPRDYATALQLLIDAERQFYELDLETRHKFDDDFRKYFAQAGTDSWYENMSKYFEKVDDNDVKESSSDES